MTELHLRHHPPPPPSPPTHRTHLTFGTNSSLLEQLRTHQNTFSFLYLRSAPMDNAANSIQVRVHSSRRGGNMIHPVSIDSPPPAAAEAPNTAAVVYREVKHFKKWVPWLIPSFIVANTVMFIITMSVNNCPKNSVSCVAGFLGRLSFQPFKENPLLGPSSSA